MIINRVAFLAALCWSQLTPAIASEGYLNVDGGRLYYEESGTGPALILLHDGLLHSVVWDDMWPGLCAKYHVIRYDRRGYGRSDAAKARFSPEEDLLQLMRHAKMERAVLVGCSSGSALAIDFALAHPHRISKLVLVGSAIGGFAFRPEHAPLFTEVASARKAGDVQALNEAMLHLFLDGPGLRHVPLIM